MNLGKFGFHELGVKKKLPGPMIMSCSSCEWKMVKVVMKANTNILYGCNSWPFSAIETRKSL